MERLSMFHIHEATLHREVKRVVRLGVLELWLNIEWATPILIIPNKNGALRFISKF